MSGTSLSGRGGAEVDFRLIDDGPSAWSAPAEPKGHDEEGAEGRPRSGLRTGRMGTDVQFPVENLRNHLLRGRLEGCLHGRGVSLGGFGSIGAARGHERRLQHARSCTQFLWLTNRERRLFKDYEAVLHAPRLS